MRECARERRVFFVEEPLRGEQAGTEIREALPNLFVVTPRLGPGDTDAEGLDAQRRAAAELWGTANLRGPILWFYTPMALEFARQLPCDAIVYDCMDELSAFHGAPSRLPELERELLSRADLVFTGGASLYAAKRAAHPSVHLFPSSVDVAHYRVARGDCDEPFDQAALRGRRFGFFGVIDERMDLELLERVASERPDSQFVMVGPVVKISESSLPRRPNLHYLGQKRYEELPLYLAGWDVALMPFALNQSTRFISPTKTLEYLAGGKPVVSTPIRDVVSPYGERGLVHIATADGFAAAIDQALATPFPTAAVDALLATTSWQNTWSRMSSLIESALATSANKVA